MMCRSASPTNLIVAAPPALINSAYTKEFPVDMKPHQSKSKGSMHRPRLSRKRRREETKGLKKGTLSDSSSEEEEEPMKTTNEKHSDNDDDELDIPYAIRDDQNHSLQLSCILSETRKEPLRPGDVIVYPPPMRIAGYSDRPRLGQVVSTALPHTVTLDNGDVLLSGDVVVRRWMEYRAQEWYPHDGIARPLGQFRMRDLAAGKLPRLPPELRKRLERKLLPTTEPNAPTKSKRIEKKTKKAKDDSSREGKASDSDDSSTASSSSSELSTLLQEALSSASKCRMVSAVEEEKDPSEQCTPLKRSPHRLSLSKQNQGSAKVLTSSAVQSRKVPLPSDDDDDDLLRPIGLKRMSDNIPTSANRPPKYPAPPRSIQGLSVTLSQKKRSKDLPSANTSDEDDDILRPLGLRTSTSQCSLNSSHSPAPPRRPKTKSFFLHQSPPRASALPNRQAQIQEFRDLVRRHREQSSPPLRPSQRASDH